MVEAEQKACTVNEDIRKLVLADRYATTIWEMLYHMANGSRWTSWLSG